MKPPRGKLPLPIIIITVCVLVFIAALYAERFSFLSSRSILKLKPCPRKNTKPKSSKSAPQNAVAISSVPSIFLDNRKCFLARKFARNRLPELCGKTWNGHFIFFLHPWFRSVHLKFTTCVWQ